MCMIYKHKLWLRNVHKDLYSSPHTEKNICQEVSKTVLIVCFPANVNRLYALSICMFQIG